jgi:hypothetical protein
MEGTKMTFSLNNRLVVEQYIKEGLKSKISGGIATPGQRDGLKGLLVLVDAHLSDGTHVPKGSIAYIREEILHTHAWASKPLNCDTFPGKFLIVELSHVEFIDTSMAIPKTIAPTPMPTGGHTIYPPPSIAEAFTGPLK